LLSPRGTWDSLTGQSPATYLSGAFIEHMSSLLPLSLPSGPVRPHDTWAVHLFNQRTNPRFGLLRSELTGRATLDSVTTDSGGSRAWITVSGEVVTTAGRDRSVTNLRSA